MNVVAKSATNLYQSTPENVSRDDSTAKIHCSPVLIGSFGHLMLQYQPLPDHSSAQDHSYCDDFTSFFIDKVQTIQSELEEIQYGIPITFNEIKLVTAEQQINHFVSGLEEEVCMIIMSSSSKYFNK